MSGRSTTSNWDLCLCKVTAVDGICSPIVNAGYALSVGTPKNLRVSDCHLFVQGFSSGPRVVCT